MIHAQTGQVSFSEHVRSTMEASLEKQRASVQKQALQATVAANVQQNESFYTVPWPTPIAQPFRAPLCEALPSEQIAQLTDEAAQKENMQAELLRAVIKFESAGRPCAVSGKGAQGLMQLMPETASEFGVADAFDPRQNIAGGSKFLKTLLTKYTGNVALALAAYNAGAARVDREGAVPAIPETTNYVSDILEELSRKK